MTAADDMTDPVAGGICGAVLRSAAQGFTKGLRRLRPRSVVGRGVRRR